MQQQSDHSARTMTSRAVAASVMCWTAIFAWLVVSLASGAALAQSADDYVIGSQDVLLVHLYDQEELSGQYTVEADGTLGFPLIGRVTAGGLTLREFEDELMKRLSDGYFRDPQVTVAVEHYRSQRVFVMGEVRQPGSVPLTGGMTLIEALAHAGSTVSTASGEVAIVRAPQGGTPGPVLPEQDAATEIFRASIRDLESGVLSQNIELRDGDTIFVSRAETVYVFGEVKNPGAYSVQKHTTVLQALSLAGGVSEHGAMNRIQIVRVEDGDEREVKVKLTDIVRPEDTIIVPQRYF